MKVVALAGGVGGAKFAHGLALRLPAEALTVVVNTGDDFEHLGLSISPDLDTVMYTLAGVANPGTGWGLAGDTFEFLGALERLGGPAWFRLGDRDLATHVERTRRLWAGARLTDVTAALCTALGVRASILPMTDDALRTKVRTDEGEIDFQEYFVQRQCRPRVTGFRFAGLDGASPTDAVTQALESAEVILFCPSNPFVSLEPILALPGLRRRIAAGLAVAVTPIVGGRALKGPADKMLAELGLDVSALGIARRFQDLLRGFVVDTVDAHLAPEVESLGLKVLVTDTLMKSHADRSRLAGAVLDFALGLSEQAS